MYLIKVEFFMKFFLLQFNGVIMDLYSETPQDVFNLNPMALEPPKEKPPPPPTELSDEEAPVPKPKVS